MVTEKKTTRATKMMMIVTMMVVVHDDHWPGLWFIMIMVLQLFMIVVVPR